jgi:hypothetical protein
MRPDTRARWNSRKPGFVAAVVALSILTGGLGGCGEKGSSGPYAGLFPDPAEIESVTGAGAVTEYRDRTLYDFLDGGAELYFDYDIVAVASREYLLPEESGIEISIYDMGNAGNAFGIYSIFRYSGAGRAEIGNEAVITPATLDFWKGKYYCKILAFGSPDEAESPMAEIGRAVADRITEAGSEPELLALLPVETRISGSEKYFRRHLALNNIRYIDSENVLNLGDGTEGVTAGYGTGESRYTGYIVSYPDSAEAAAAFERYSGFLRGKGKEVSRNGVNMFILASGDEEAVALHGRHVAGVWDAEADGMDFIEAVLACLASVD